MLIEKFENLSQRAAEQLQRCESTQGVIDFSNHLAEQGVQLLDAMLI